MTGSRERKTARVLSLLCAVTVLAGASSCNAGREVPVVSETHTSDKATIEEQREWARAQVDAVIAETDTQGKWGWWYDKSVRWEDQSQYIMEESVPSRCTFNSGEANPAAQEVGLYSDRLDEDPFVLLERVWEMWEAQGWEVSQVYRVDEPNRRDWEIRAEGENGAGLVASASDQAGGKLLMLDVTAACSSHPSVAW